MPPTHRMHLFADSDHYAVLEVEADASPQAVRQAYRRAAQQHHPDRQPGDHEAPERMARINEAYAVLSHPQRRASYDQWLQARHARDRADAAAQAARPSRFEASWPWGLVAATLAIVMATFGTVVYKVATTATPAAPGHLTASR